MRLRLNTAALYIKHLAIAWPGLFLGTAILGLLLDKTPADALFDFPASAPVFVGYWAVGALAGFWLSRGERSRAACWVWLPPLLLTACSLPGYFRYPMNVGWAGVWTAYFSRGCGGSECLVELMETAPLITCVAYSLGAWWARCRAGRGAGIARCSPDRSNLA